MFMSMFVVYDMFVYFVMFMFVLSQFSFRLVC